MTAISRTLKPGWALLALCLAIFISSCHVPEEPETGRSGRKTSPKRGVSYNFNFPRPNNSDSGPGHNNTAIIEEDMNLLGPGISWFYSWGTSPDSAVSTVANQKKLAFVPMVHRSASNLDDVRKYVSAHPDVKYILAYNEPNFYDQANMTPVQAAEHWPQLMALAKELGLKIVSPAMNYGTMQGYGSPTKWLEEFFGTDGNPGFPNVSLDDVDAIAVHLYNDFGNNVRQYIDRFRKFGKPIWMTEFCAWDDKSGQYFKTPEFQTGFMSQAVIYMELDPLVERYAWFIPKGGKFASEGDFPWNKLLTAVNPAASPNLPVLTDLGKVFVNMSICDKTVYFVPGEIIAAKDFSNNNISELVPSTTDPFTANTRTWQDGIRFRPTANTKAGAPVLDIEFFMPSNNPNNMWVEYQLYIPKTRQYALTLYYTASKDANMTISIDGSPVSTAVLNKSDVWVSKTVTLNNVAAGKHTIRLLVTGGNCVLNWLKIE
ncbi:MAG: carbohydrate-binding protein [Treponema sp.]|nr:carbohydrate-binding protein [Treponema sp.]